MGNFFKWFFIILIIAAAALAGFVAMQPAHFEVVRMTKIDAPPEVVFEQVNDFHKWEAWSPWAKMDPSAKATFDGPPSGKDSKMSWDGNSDVGAGSMTIVESKSPDTVKLKLEFKRPMEGVADTLFTFAPDDKGKTTVTWKMSGENGFVGKAFSLVFNCEKMIGPQFEEGLANMKKVSEDAAKTPS